MPMCPNPAATAIGLWETTHTFLLTLVNAIATLQEQPATELPKESEEYRVYLDHSDGNVIQILIDPRFSAPLLILLNFVIVYIVLALAGYAVGVFLPRKVGQIILTGVAAILLLPLLVEALRLREFCVLLGKKGRMRTTKISELIL